MTRVSGRAAAAGAVVAVYFATLAVTLPDIGLTDDADAYLGASIEYARWWQRLLGGDLSALGREAVDASWRSNAEHPPLGKLAMGAAWWLFHEQLGWMGNVASARMATVLLSTVLAWLVYRVAEDLAGRLAAVSAPLFLLTMPSFFFHSHVETLDVPVAATSFAVIYAFARGLRRAPWAVGSGLFFGLALATKLNAPFLLVAFVAFVVVKHLDPRASPDVRHRVQLAVVSMCVLGPIVFLGLWPWLWVETGARLRAYLDFHLHHYGILFFYFGRIYETPPAPWHAPLVMTVITTPPLVLALALVGSGVTLRGFARGPAEAESGRDLGVLLLLSAAVILGSVSWPGVPRYGGVKLFLPLFPLLAVLAGTGLEACASWLAVKRPWRWLGPALVAAAIAPGAVSLARIHPYELSYYNVLVGGLPGAVRIGFERQYYDLIYVELVEWMNENLPSGARVTFLPNNKEYLRNSPWWFRDGRIRGDLRFVDLAAADVLVLTHERRWPEYPALAERYRAFPVLWQLETEGVPLLTVVRLHHVIQ